MPGIINYAKFLIQYHQVKSGQSDPKPCAAPWHLVNPICHFGHLENKPQIHDKATVWFVFCCLKQGIKMSCQEAGLVQGGIC